MGAGHCYQFSVKSLHSKILKSSLGFALLYFAQLGCEIMEVRRMYLSLDRNTAGGNMSARAVGLFVFYLDRGERSKAQNQHSLCWLVLIKG